MNIALVWFSCDKDLPFFKESFKCVERLKKLHPEHKFTSYVSLEKRDNKEFHCADKVSVSNWERQGALRGREAFQCVLDVYITALFKDGNDIVVKVDSDTILNNLSWLSSVDTKKTGFFSTIRNEYFSLGGSYVLTNLGLNYICSLWDRVDIRGRAFNLPDYKENVLIHRLIRFGGIPYGSISSDNKVENSGLCLYEDFVWEGENQYAHKYPSYEEINKHYAITFRSSWNKSGGENNRALSRMKNFNKWKEDNEKAH